MSPEKNHYTADLAPQRLNKLQIKVLNGCSEREIRIDRHVHKYLELLYLLEGRRILVTPRGQYEAGAGDLIMFHPHEMHEEVSPAGHVTFIVLRFPQPRMGRKLRFPARRETPPVVRLPWPERFRHLFDQMVLEKEMQDCWGDIMNKVYMVEFTVLLRRALQSLAEQDQNSQTGRSILIGKIIKFIHDDLSKNISLNKLARQSLMSQSNLSHIFKEITGIPPKRYYLQAKMAKAKDLLTGTEQSVKSIAAVLGYLDEHYFSRIFKKLTGIAPGRYRVKIKKVH